MRASYHDIKASILHRIRSNIWPPGAHLPGEIELAEEFGCARATMNRAMRELVDEGILDRKRKAGTKVKAYPIRRAQFSIPIIREEITNLGAEYRYSLIEKKAVAAPDWLKSRINFPKGTKVLYLRCMHYAGRDPYQLEERWINLSAVPGAKDYDFEEVGPNEWLLKEVPFTDGELVFSATNASKEIANFLDTTEGTAIFTIERTTWLDKLNVTYARLYFSRDYKMTSRL